MSSFVFLNKTNSPFLVKFTDRGFLVGDTRLSFGLIEKAISKQFSLTLKNGLILTPVKMQKILKYQYEKRQINYEKNANILFSKNGGKFSESAENLYNNNNN